MTKQDNRTNLREKCSRDLHNYLPVTLTVLIGMWTVTILSEIVKSENTSKVAEISTVLKHFFPLCKCLHTEVGDWPLEQRHWIEKTLVSPASIQPKTCCTKNLASYSSDSWEERIKHLLEELLCLLPTYLISLIQRTFYYEVQSSLCKPWVILL